MCAIQLLSSCSLLKLALAVAAEGIQLDSVGGEAAVGNLLLAKGTDGTKVQQDVYAEVFLTGQRTKTKTSESHRKLKTHVHAEKY